MWFGRVPSEKKPLVHESSGSTSDSHVGAGGNVHLGLGQCCYLFYHKP